ncbi:protein Flattop isoform X2 [Xiphias gladius]|uniref:protein Flattop isoform X2 n=1 Tax=Xiphias gladius TaxID=8245 RepID=UPI001A98E88A|nr:protein Flattop isoform X2 [Xiphias gladius]
MVSLIVLLCNESTKTDAEALQVAEMSSNFSANQYDSAFKSQRLQNWCENKQFKERPTAQEGHTTFIANDRGHLLPGVVKSGSAWPDFKGTWDLPARIPAYRINPTGRSVEGLNRLKSWGFDPQRTGMSQPHSCSKNSDKLQDVGKQISGDVQQDRAVSFTTAESRPASQNCPITGCESTASQNQDSQAAEAGSVDQSAEDKQATQATGKDRPLSQHSAAEEKPALRPDAEEGTNSRSKAGKGRPVSNVSEKAASQEAPSFSQQRHRDVQEDQ